ncbi:hypothetical protein EUGRSUZ_E03860 [Eucalyptus grandis]|uniref:Uncharacterized protein n=2 Tax=Eucalyptus grandis TaxID=71139 RepID=A0ACC3L1E0_EUCGR|nr:hypothetical protein EUGRSUZ_E03860 [Eucalyptus grandis]
MVNSRRRDLLSPTDLPTTSLPPSYVRQAMAPRRLQAKLRSWPSLSSFVTEVARLASLLQRIAAGHDPRRLKANLTRPRQPQSTWFSCTRIALQTQAVNPLAADEDRMREEGREQQVSRRG